MMSFDCGSQYERWEGKIVSLEDYGGFYEMIVESRSRFHIIFGRVNFGNFICITNYKVGLLLSRLDDVYWNTNEIGSQIGDIDGVTVATALYEVSKII